MSHAHQTPSPITSTGEPVAKVGAGVEWRSAGAGEAEGATPLDSWSRRWARALATAQVGWGAVAVLAAIVGLAAVLRVAALPGNGLGNQYYAAAAVSMAQSPSNFFFAALDPGGFISVDKPPLALWPQAIAVRVFGLSPWSVLLPQVVAGLATVILIYGVARQALGTAAGLTAALVLALSPISVAVDRTNLPDTTLVLLLVLAAWLLQRATAGGSLGALLAAAALVGLAFNTKMLQAYLVVPAFGLIYLVAGAGSARRRLLSLLAAAIVLGVVSASWMSAVDLIPPSSRPYVGGSRDNTVLDLVVGYNGFSRIIGNDEVPGPGAGNAGPTFGGRSGWARLLNAEVGPQISWLLPLAVISLLAPVLDRRRSGRTDPARAAALLWGGWLATHFLVFSFARGIFHPYYTNAMAPAVAVLCGVGLVTLLKWQGGGGIHALLLPTALMVTIDWALVMVIRAGWGAPWLPALVAGLALISSLGLLVSTARHRLRIRRLSTIGVAAGVIGILVGPMVWSVTTVGAASMSVNPTAGLPGAMSRGVPGGPFPDGGALRAPPGFGLGGMGLAADPPLLRYLLGNQGAARFLVATTSSMSAAPLIIATQKPVVPMGGFNGWDPAPTVQGLQELIASGQLRYVLLGGAEPFGLRGQGERSEWVQANCQLVDPDLYGGSPGDASSALGGGAQSLYDCAGVASHAIDADRLEAFAAVVEELPEYGESLVVNRSSGLHNP